MKTLQKNPHGLFTTSKSFSSVQAQLETQTKNLSLSSEMLREFLENYCVLNVMGRDLKLPPRAGFVSIKMHVRTSLLVGFSVQAGEGNGKEFIVVWLL